MPRGMFGRFRGSNKSSSCAVIDVATPEGPSMKRVGVGASLHHASLFKAKSSGNPLGNLTRNDDASDSSIVASNNARNRKSTTNLQGVRKRHIYRNSCGEEASISTTASFSDISTMNGSRKPRSSCYNNGRRNRRQRPHDVREEEKKEVACVDEEDGGISPTPEFHNRVAHEAAELDKEGNNYFEKGDYDKAFMSYERALKLKRSSLRDDKEPGAYDMLNETESQKASILASVATSINNMTYLRQRAGQATADETMAAYLKSLQIKREILGPSHLSVGKTLNNIGSVFYLKKEFVPALKAYENAYDIMSEQLGDTHLDIGTVLSNIGDVHTAMMDKPKAIDFYKRALDIRWSQLGRNDPKVIRLMEQTASLETGKQPRRKEAESDSEDEEFVKEDKERLRVFQEECQALQAELIEDIRFFDLVERTLAIELVQQKTKFMRALRSMKISQEESTTCLGSSQVNDGDAFSDVDDFSDDESAMSVMSAPPDLDGVCHSKEDAPEVLAFLHDIGADKLSDRSAQQKCRSPKKGAVTPSLKFSKPSTPPTVSTNATVSSPRRNSWDCDNSLDDEKTMVANGSPTRPSRLHFPVHRRHKHSKYATYLTPEERRLALLTVQERVATLKSKRESEMEMQGLDSRNQGLIRSRSQMYLDATRIQRFPDEPPPH